MISVAVFGSNGFVGKSLCLSLKKSGFNVVGVTRENYNNFIGQYFNIIINTAHPSARYKAKINPALDFKETVLKTANIYHEFKFDKFIHISSISARTQLNSVYGRHKLMAETICNHGNNLIIRLSSMFDKTLKKGALIDILNDRKVFVDGDSCYAFSSLKFVSNYISSNLDLTGVIELGAKNSVKLIEIAEYLKKDIQFEGILDIQEVKNPKKDYPDAKEVFSFMDKMI